MAEPFGYWTFNGKNGLAGVDGSLEQLPDGRVVYTPDPDNPAVLAEEFIVNSLMTSRVARKQFDVLFPLLLPEEQERLLGILEMRPYVTRMLCSPKEYYDRIQTREIRSSVRLPKGSSTGARAAASTSGTVAVGSYTPESS